LNENREDRAVLNGEKSYCHVPLHLTELRFVKRLIFHMQSQRHHEQSEMFNHYDKRTDSSV